MSWLRVAIPFGIAFIQGFRKEYNAPPGQSMLQGFIGGNAAPSRRASPGGYTIVDSGSAMGWQWVAVPKREVRAFKAAHPEFSNVMNFFKVIEKLRKRGEDTSPMNPVILPVCDMVVELDDACQVFVCRAAR